jgi:hypothetical protein
MIPNAIPHGESSSAGAAQLSPGRKSWVRRNRTTTESRRDDPRVPKVQPRRISATPMTRLHEFPHDLFPHDLRRATCDVLRTTFAVRRTPPQKNTASPFELAACLVDAPQLISSTIRRERVIRNIPRNPIPRHDLLHVPFFLCHSVSVVLALLMQVMLIALIELRLIVG